jgi:hypothetical protein
VVFLGYALNSTTNGKILVSPKGGDHLAYLHDVSDGAPTAGRILYGNGTHWTALAPASGWLHNTAGGVVSYSTPTASDVGAIPTGGAVLSVTQSGTSIAVGGTATDPTVALNLANSNTWTAKQIITMGSWDYGLLVNGGSISAGEIGVTNGTVIGYNTSAGAGWFGTNSAGSFNVFTLANMNANAAASANFAAYINGANTSQLRFGRSGAAGTMVLANADAGGTLITHTTFDTNGITNAQLAGSGTRMVTASDTGLLATAAIPDLSGYLPLTGGIISGNLTIGDASSDTLTVNATPTFTATSVTWAANTVFAGGASWSGAQTFNASPRISMAEPILRIRDSDAASGSATAGYIQWMTSADGEVGYFGRKGSDTAGLHRWVNGAGSIEIAPATAFIVTTLAGTGTRITTSSSTGLQGSRLASSYITQTLTANAAIALDTELLRMTGTGFTGTLTTSLGNSRVISFRNSGTGNMTIACAGAETIDGIATLVIPVGGIGKICSVGSGVWETVL